MTTRLLKQGLLSLAGLVGAVILALAVSLFTGTTATTTFYYSVTDLGNFGGVRSEANGLNDKEEVVGHIFTSSNEMHAVLWQNGNITDLDNFFPTSPEGGSNALSINNAGQVVGYSATQMGLVSAILWSNGQTTDLGSLPGYSNGNLATDINDAGQVVGLSGMVPRHAFLWQNGQLTDLGPSNAFVSEAMSINNSGQVVGYSYSFRANGNHAFLWSNGTATDLGTLGGDNSSAYDINASEAVVGCSKTSNETSHAFLWDSGAIADLGTLGGTESCAYAINNAGKVVGYSTMAPSGNSSYHAFVWHNGTMTDLNNLLPPNSGWELTSASDINNNGQIVGSGTFNAQHRNYLLTPVTVIN